MPVTLSERIAVCTGTFDPVHLGHLDIIERGSRMFDQLVVGVGPNPDKAPFFSAAERVALLQDVVGHLPNVRVQAFEGLAVQFVRSVGARIMLRGLRTLSDMEYEFSMSLMNLTLDPELETIFLMAREEYSHVSSSLLRQVAQFGGDLSKFLPPTIRVALEQRARERGLLIQRGKAGEKQHG
jgi:pantetheine-phosphate adenylyltransferase